jgi:hypothetical protein
VPAVVAPPPPAPPKLLPAAAPSVAAAPGRLDSLIVREYPPLFEEFRAKRFNLLWRGSRDGFGAEFHRRCDGRANTLTLILDTKGNVFGGFTPVEWESRMWNGKQGDENSTWEGDDGLRSFLFMLRNPRGVPPRKVALRTRERQRAIDCDSKCGPLFGSGDIHVSDNCNARTRSFTHIDINWSGRTYANDTAVEYFFTGAFNFTIKEIEVFEIAD